MLPIRAKCAAGSLLLAALAACPDGRAPSQAERVLTGASASPDAGAKDLGAAADSLWGTPEVSAPAPSDLKLADALGCVLVEPGAVLRIDFGGRGCFGGSDNLFRLSNGCEGLAVEGFIWEDVYARRRVPPSGVGVPVAALWLDVLAQILRRPQVKDRCVSTATHFARVSVYCGGKWATTKYETDACADFGGFEQDVFGGSPTFYQYALELSTAAEAALRSMPNQSVTKLTEDELRRLRRKWDSLYNSDGMRVRHDPIEEWDEGL